jgi:nitrogen fixation NifU-like protein
MVEPPQVGYSKKVMEHFMNPRNVGVIESPDGYGKVGNPVCGDLMEIFITVRGDRIADIKFRTFGCGSAIATSSMVTEMAKGMTLGRAMELTRQDVADELDGLPPHKMHCSNLAADALHAAIRDYWRKQGRDVGPGPGEEGRHEAHDEAGEAPPPAAPPARGKAKRRK